MRDKQIRIINEYLMELGIVDGSVLELSDAVVTLLAGFIIKERRSA